MGWLRDLMDQAPVRARSFGALARAALAHPEWPEGVAPQERSLAALLSKLDHERDLEWLADRLEVQQVLAELLGVPPDRIRGSLQGRLGRSDAARGVVRWRDAPFAAPLSLADEPLPPGIPEDVSQPGRWGASHWRAGAGSGRTIAGRWLEARGLATFVQARTLEEAVGRLPATGPVFIELEAPLPENALPPRSPVLVAAAPAVSGSGASSFDDIPCDPPEAWLPSLVEWLERRLPRDGRFDPRGALRWLTRARETGLVDSFGAALGLSALVDLYGSAELERAPLRDIAGRFVEDRLERTKPRGETGKDWLGEGGSSLLVRLARRLLTEDTEEDLPWDAPRTREQWIALVPPELRSSVDTEWVRLALGRAISPVTVRELERSLRELPPGSFRMIQALERAGILVTEEDGRLLLGPRWLALHAMARAREELAAGLPEEWGEALLGRTGAADMAGRIHARARALDETLLDDVLETDAGRSPAAAAAVEMAFRATGLSLLAGDDAPDEVLPLLWDQCLSLAIEAPDGPRPCVDYPEAWADDEWLLHVGTFRLAALALSEALPPHRGREHALLRPWSRPPPRAAWKALLDSVWRALQRADPERQSWVLGAFELFGRLRTLHGGDEPLHPLEWPAQVALDIARGRLSWDTWKAGAAPATMRALELLVRQQGAPAALAGRSVWAAWLREPQVISHGSSLWPRTEPGRTLFRYVSGDALQVALARGLLAVEDIPFHELEEGAWQALETCIGAIAGADRAWAAMPPRIFRAALRDAATRRTPLGVAWTAAPARVLEAIETSTRDDAPVALHAACEAPEGLTSEITPHLLRLARDADPEGKRRIELTLHDRIRRRAPGFRGAFAALSSLR